MTRFQSELVRRLRKRFWMAQSMFTDDMVLRATKDFYGRWWIEFKMNAEALWAGISGREPKPWMVE